MSRLFVNIDHVATLREARGGNSPSPLQALYDCQSAGVQGVTLHLREDERHIKEQDVYDIKQHKSIPMNLESSIDERIVHFVCKLCPEITCIVPERRKEITTEGGLDVVSFQTNLKKIIERYHDCGIEVSLFVEPKKDIIEVCKVLGANSIEIHTGEYANASYKMRPIRLNEIKEGIDFAYGIGLKVNLGHGLNYENIHPLLNNPKVSDFNIGHSIISEAIFVGLRSAVLEMRRLIET